MAEGDNKPKLNDVIGIGNKVRVIFGHEPAYDNNQLNTIAGRGMSPIRMTSGDGRIDEVVPMYSWQTVYDAYIASGISEERARQETNVRVIILD